MAKKKKSTLGRPKKPPNELRNGWLPARVSPSERAEVARKARKNGLSVTAWIRKRLGLEDTGYGDMRISDMRTGTLSTRALSALRCSGIELRSQIIPESFYGLKNCGKATVRELIEWTETYGDHA